METRHCRGFLLLFFLTMSFIGCDKNEGATGPRVTDPWIEGSLNGTDICISKHATFNGVAGWYTIPAEIDSLSSDVDLPHSWWYRFSREITDTDYHLTFSLTDLHDKVYSNHTISEGKVEELKESCSIMKGKYPDYESYYPSKAPCNITVDHLETPMRLTGRINGIFYNTTNQQDSIILNVTIDVE